jgi:hypothetical protein
LNHAVNVVLQRAELGAHRLLEAGRPRELLAQDLGLFNGLLPTEAYRLLGPPNGDLFQTNFLPPFAAFYNLFHHKVLKDSTAVDRPRQPLAGLWQL